MQVKTNIEMTTASEIQKSKIWKKHAIKHLAEDDLQKQSPIV